MEFSVCMDLKNPWNDNKPVKISRDGQVRVLIVFVGIPLGVEAVHNAEFSGKYWQLENYAQEGSFIFGVCNLVGSY